MKRRLHVVGSLACWMLLALGTEAWSDPLTINVGSTSYETVLRSRIGSRVTQLSTTSPDPIIGAILYETNPEPYWPGPYLAATADALLFDVAGRGSSAALAGSRASAASTTVFSPTSSGTASLEINVVGRRFYGIGSIELFDVTANQQVWQYASCGSVCDLVPDFSPDTIVIDLDTSSVLVDQMFDTSHLYRLSVYTAAFSAGDTVQMRTYVSGLTAVPEPSTMLLTALAFVGWGWCDRRRCRWL